MASPPRSPQPIHDHHLGAVDGASGTGEIGPFPRRDHAHERPPEIVDYVVRQVAAVVKAFVQNGGILAHLRKEVAVEVGEAAIGGIRF